MKKVTTNFLYNSIYQIMLILLPIITIPYISRVLEVSDIGTYSYTLSIVKYFTYFAMLGLQNYGNRSIAVDRDDKIKLNRTFSEIFIMQLITTCVISIIFFIYMFFFQKRFQLIFLIQSLALIACFFDVSWVFFGLEKFKITVTRNIFIKLLTIVMILFFVKQSTDLWKYTLIMSSSILLSNLILYVTLFKYVKIVKVKYEDIKKHIKPNFTLFIPVLAVSVYRLLAKVMLGNISGVFELGLFENIDKLIDVPMGFITALGLVMLPHMSNLVKKNNIEQMNEVMEKSLVFVMFMSIAFTFGLYGISNNFIPVFLGNKFKDAIIIMKIVSPVLLFKGWANVIRTQYLIPREKYNSYMVSLVLGAVTNVLLNLILIPFFAAVGTAISVLITEILVCIIQSWYVKEDINIKNVYKHVLFFLSVGIFMLLIINFIYYKLGQGILTLLIQIFVGSIIYLSISFLYYKKRIEKNYAKR